MDLTETEKLFIRSLLLVVVSLPVAKVETVDYGYNVHSGSHVEVSGTHLLSRTVTSTGPSEQQYNQPVPST